jgi:hypothetical protein
MPKGYSDLEFNGELKYDKEALNGNQGRRQFSFF